VVGVIVVVAGSECGDGGLDFLVAGDGLGCGFIFGGESLDCGVAVVLVVTGGEGEIELVAVEAWGFWYCGGDWRGDRGVDFRGVFFGAVAGVD
jgi:hypothetical protein